MKTFYLFFLSFFFLKKKFYNWIVLVKIFIIRLRSQIKIIIFKLIFNLHVLNFIHHNIILISETIDNFVAVFF